MSSLLSPPSVSLTRGLLALEALGEATRLRIAALLADAELTVTELTAILGQSQPRVSRHLKLLCDAGIAERHREGAWAFFRLMETGAEGRLARMVLAALDTSDPVLAADRERLAAVRQERARAAEAYFQRASADWDRVRGLLLPEQLVEERLRERVASRPFRTLLDLGTGTGAIALLLAPLAERVIGVDQSSAMLGLARAKVEAAGARNIMLRQADIQALPIEAGSQDVVVLHQVLHFLDEPGRAVREAARVLRPGGRLFIVDFAPHQEEALRLEHAHRRLGFAAEELHALFRESGLVVGPTERLSGGDNTLAVLIAEGRDPRLHDDRLGPAHLIQEFA